MSDAYAFRRLIQKLLKPIVANIDAQRLMPCTRGRIAKSRFRELLSLISPQVGAMVLSAVGTSDQDRAHCQVDIFPGRMRADEAFVRKSPFWFAPVRCRPIVFATFMPLDPRDLVGFM